jgi:hypothetical protein
LTTKPELKKSSKKGKKKKATVAGASLVKLQSEASEYFKTRNKKFHTKSKARKSKMQTLETEYEKVEEILGNKNISYGYGDSKNRDKVLKFIHEVRNKQV